MDKPVVYTSLEKEGVEREREREGGGQGRENRLVVIDYQGK